MKDPDKWYREIYNTAKVAIDANKVNPIEFATALINVSKLLLIEEVGPTEAQILFDFANKSFIVESDNITYH